MREALGWRQIVLVVAAFGLVLLAFGVVGVAPFPALGAMLKGSVGTGAAWRDTLRETTPLLIAGLAVYVALRAGLFNIGAEGQFTVGALAAAWAALYVHGPAGMVLAVVLGALGGALWALPAGLIKAYRGGHEVITTIMLNNVALLLTQAVVAGPLKAADRQSPTTRMLDDTSRLPWLVDAPPFRLSLAVPIAVVLVAVVAVWLKRTVSGYELRAAGANPTAARFAGIGVASVVMRAMVVSGLLAGLAGAVQVLAYEGRFYAGFSPGYGFDALGVAILAGGSAWGVVPGALAFGALNQGSTSVQLLGIPKGISGLLLGLLIVAFAAFRYRRRPVHD